MSRKTPVDPTLLTPVSDAMEEAEVRKAAREEREQQIEEIDREAIDKVILSSDVQKGGKIRIERKGPLEQNYQFILTMPADQWKDTDEVYEHIKRIYGGGDYRCQTFRANGQLYKPFSFSIDYRFKGKLDEDEIRRLSFDASKSPAAADGLSKLFETIKADKDTIKPADLISLMDRSSAKSEQNSIVMLTMMMKSMEMAQSNMAAMMAAMAQAFSNRPQQDNTILLELLRQREKQTPINETLDMMAKIKDLFEQPTDEKEDMFSKIGKIAGPLLSGMMGQQQVTAPPTQAQIANSQPGPKLGGFCAVVPPKYRVLLEMGIRAAQKNADPATYAELIIDQTDAKGLAWLRGILTEPDWCDKLFGDEASVTSIRPWLDDLRTLILEYGTEDNSGAGSESAGAPVPAGQPFTGSSPDS